MKIDELGNLRKKVDDIFLMGTDEDSVVFWKYECDAIQSLIDAEIERQEPCEWCNGKENKLAEGEYTGLYMTGNTITAYGEGEAVVEIKYCPNCGRNLT